MTSELIIMTMGTIRQDLTIIIPSLIMIPEIIIMKMVTMRWALIRITPLIIMDTGKNAKMIIKEILSVYIPVYIIYVHFTLLC